ncbi:MBL fold metallo-hydrolase [Luteibacter sp. NPDC031894]|uniref:MBL fold metallo-hydrolase n=1 Tax=Luteibacter sp. NPDC031894 TaxID=3390572 RepID=UPI003CFE3C09
MKRIARHVGVAAAIVVALIVFAAVSAWPNIGTNPDGARLSRYAHSPQWHGDRFDNPLPMYSNIKGGIFQLLRSQPGEEPDRPVPTVDSSALYAAAPASGLRITWFGHSSMLVEIDGTNIVVDPLWSERASPFPWLGPERWYEPPVPIENLPRIDAVLVSHDHYDHLDRASIQALNARGVRFIVPLGIGSHLVGWGVPEQRITELDWWQETTVGDVRVVSTPSRHASGRLSPRSNQTLWTGFALVGPAHRAFYSGDTGLNDTFVDVGEKLGPFDVTMIESGQYDPQWPDWHLGPEQAVRVHEEVRGRVLIPVHWGLIKLAHHAWTEPAERVLAAAACRHAEVLIPEPGQAVEPTLHPKLAHWWPRQRWYTAVQHPIVASRRGDPNDLFPTAACPKPADSVRHYQAHR